jgi:capsular exopolysaccharide synthesis family protein
LDKVREQQIGEVTTQLMTAREDVNDKRDRLEQARHVIDTNGDPDSIPELSPTTSNTEPWPTLSNLRRKQMELNWSAADLRNKLGERNVQVISIKAQLAAVNKQIASEAERILNNMKNDYDIAVKREQSLEANLQSLTANQNSEAYIKLRQLQRLADADRSDYQTYLTQYNDISEKRELQNAGVARIISPASLPREPSKNRTKFYALGGLAGLGGGFLLAFLLEYFRPGVKTSTEIEQTFRLPVVGAIPLVKTRDISRYRLLERMVHEPLSQLSETVHAMRISLELLSANPKVILITSALPGEGKSTAAMLLAASSARSGKRTILLDCDFRLHSTSEALRRLRSKHRPGLSELLRGEAKLEDVIIEDPITKIRLIPAGSIAPNAADLLMSQGMLDLIAVLRSGFDYIVMDAPPLLPVVDALALATVADKILVIVEWRRTPHASIYEAFRILGREANRVAGIVLNKVELNQLPGYGGGYYRSISKYFSDA